MRHALQRSDVCEFGVVCVTRCRDLTCVSLVSCCRVRHALQRSDVCEFGELLSCASRVAEI